MLFFFIKINLILLLKKSKMCGPGIKIDEKCNTFLVQALFVQCILCFQIIIYFGPNLYYFFLYLSHYFWNKLEKVIKNKSKGMEF